MLQACLKEAKALKHLLVKLLLMSQKMGRLASKGKPELKEQYSQCRTQAEKRYFFYNVYLLDPDVSSKTVRKFDSDKQKEQVSTMEGWWTKEQIAQDKGILPHMDNYKALTDASVAGLQERPHEDEQLAKLGVMQYEYTFVEKKKKQTKEQELQLQEHVEDVATDDFNAMRLALGGGPKQKTTLAEGEVESKAEELQALGQKILDGHKDIKKQLTVIKSWATNPK